MVLGDGAFERLSQESSAPVAQNQCLQREIPESPLAAAITRGHSEKAFVYESGS